MSTQTIRKDATDPRGDGRSGLEMVVIPVSDVDRAKRFTKLGWRLDADFGADTAGAGDTPAHRAPSTSAGNHHSGARLAQNLYLVVSDIEAARAKP